MDKIKTVLTNLKISESELQQQIQQHSKLITVNTGDVLVKEGQYLNFLPIVIKGSIRVFQQRDDREILLYHVLPGQTCIMSFSAAYFNTSSTSYGVAAEPGEILVLPTTFISDWQLKYPSWNAFVISTFRNRYDELVHSYESVAFDNIDSRVISYLSKNASIEKSSSIKISHQKLANELGTTRVVISRILKQFEKDKKVRLFRGFIELL